MARAKHQLAERLQALALAEVELSELLPDELPHATGGSVFTMGPEKRFGL